MNNTRIGDRAVVVGASIAGLLATHVLANSYGQVIVIDRDQMPGSRPWRSCFPVSPRNWSPTGRWPVVCWPTHACISAATGFGRRIPDWCSSVPADHS
jgi:cation diffusion facilitator CzcD-associated flavoprotein CzcO